MPTRSALFFLFLLLVCVPVAAAAYLGAAGLAREKAVRIERERDAMERRADEVRDALVRELQQLYRAEAGRGVALLPAASQQQQEPSHPAISDRFLVRFDGRLAWPWEGRPPADIEAFGQSPQVTALLDVSRPLATPLRVHSDLPSRVSVSDLGYEGELVWRLVQTGRPDAQPMGEPVRRMVEGFRLDAERLARLYLDPLSPEGILPRFEERLDEVRLVRDDPRERVLSSDAYGLPQAIYRHVVPGGRNAPPVLLPPGYLLALSVHPSASLARDLEEAGQGLLWILIVVGAVVAAGMLFLWRALRAEARLAERREEFVNAVSHELRTPLTSIRMYADMLKEGWVGDPGTAREYVSLVSAESERLARLVNNVLDFSRIEKGRKSFDLQLGDPAPVIREVAGVLRPYLEDKGFRLELDLPESLPSCRFDKDALTQVLVNLIDNAVKYGRTEVRIEAAGGDGPVRLRVLDRGPGVAADERESIFDPFRRGRAAEGGGTGLGLALVRHYVTAHGGRVWVEDREGGGAAFTLTLPTAA